MSAPITTDQLIPMDDELIEEVKTLLALFGAELIGIDFHKRRKKYINGKGNEASRPLLPGEEPDFRSACVGLKVKAFNVGGAPAYDFKAKELIHCNVFNEVTREKLNSHASFGLEGVIEIRHGGYTYHRNNRFKPVLTDGFMVPLLEA